jgi:long-chain fatty acid transport protein
LALAALSLALAARGALAGGFAIDDRSASQLGVANAGAAAAGEDASTIADNPAGIAHLSSPQLVASGTFINAGLPFKNSGSVFPGGAPIGGANDDGGTFAPVPSFFYSSPVGDGLSAGIGLFSSFGLATDYNPTWVGRYQAQSTELTSIDLAPTLAYQLLPNLAVGISPVARYSKAKFATAIDFGAIGAGAGIPGAAPGSADGAIKIKGSGWSFAFNGGFLWEPTDTTRLGIAYFHNDSVTLTGGTKFERPTLGNVIAAATGTFINTAATTTLPLPDHLNLGIVQTISPELDLRAGLTWTQWSAFKEERFVFANPLQPDAVTNESWHDTVTVSVGGTYKLTPDLVLRAGLGFDQTPIPDPQHRDARLPDASRIETAIGFGYSITPATSVDVAYEHLFGDTVKINEATATGDLIVGTTHLSADIFAVQLTVRF